MNVDTLLLYPKIEDDAEELVRIVDFISSKFFQDYTSVVYLEPSDGVWDRAAKYNLQYLRYKKHENNNLYIDESSLSEFVINAFKYAIVVSLANNSAIIQDRNKLNILLRSLGLQEIAPVSTASSSWTSPSLGVLTMLGATTVGVAFILGWVVRGIDESRRLKR